MKEETIQALARAARSASEKAYCPYSNFPVGAAALADDGTIYAGCNVENASFGLTVCAERNAVFHAVSSGRPAIEAVLIYTPTPEPVLPCGACRQVLAEFCPDGAAAIISICETGERIETTVGELLPSAFRLDP